MGSDPDPDPAVSQSAPAAARPREPDPSTFRETVGAFPLLVALRGRVPPGYLGGELQRLVFITPSGRVVPVDEPAGGAREDDLLPFEVQDEDVPMDTRVPDTWQQGDKVTTTLRSRRLLEIIAPPDTRPGVALEFSLPLSELREEFDGSLLNVEETALPPPPPPPPPPPVMMPPPPPTIVMPPYPQLDSEAMARAVASAMAAAGRMAAGNADALLRAIRQVERSVEEGRAEARRAASEAREAAEAAAEEARRAAADAAAEAQRVASEAAETARQNQAEAARCHAEAMRCHAAAMLSQEQMEARVLAQQKEVAEAQSAHVLFQTQIMLDELLAKMPKPAPPPPPPPPPSPPRKPCVTDRGVQCGGWDRGLQAGGVDETTQHDPLLEDMACQTEAPPPAKPLIVPLASSVSFNAFSAEVPRKPADIFWYHQVHTGPPGTKQGRYVRQ